MRSWSFFNQINVVCENYLDIKFSDSVPAIKRNKDLETRITEDVLHSEFCEEKQVTLFQSLGSM
ncbi:hypothetical protein HMPREF9007_01984 [Bacteroides sp. 1_1_14]|nr:hypothetical protein HMPREF9007_01984 [Bacteroides sp. 1_1_14]